MIARIFRLTAIILIFFLCGFAPQSDLRLTPEAGYDENSGGIPFANITLQGFEASGDSLLVTCSMPSALALDSLEMPAFAQGGSVVYDFSVWEDGGWKQLQKGLSAGEARVIQNDRPCTRFSVSFRGTQAGFGKNERIVMIFDIPDPSRDVKFIAQTESAGVQSGASCTVKLAGASSPAAESAAAEPGPAWYVYALIGFGVLIIAASTAAYIAGRKRKA